ncbi:hypothetical protein F511_23591 [Dorcoceras hygrometricum]|uniref:Uncharacterized protein n=1 Tax=Dorcoceras hygrometricum TaxID=472368 RepID=A0A2Z7BPL0_9LAMI|nr:hypothetical protein F511_23591 [Dorcoceras hygrometricum]
MASSLSINAMQVNFESVLSMEHIGMVRMFKSMEEIGLKGFLEVSGTVFEGAVIEFFANTKVIAGTIVSFVANKKMIITKDVFAETFGLPSEGMGSATSSWPTFSGSGKLSPRRCCKCGSSSDNWAEARNLLLTGATPSQQEKPKIIAIEFSTQAEQTQTTEKQPAQPEGQVEDIVRTVEDVEEIEAMNSQEHQAHENEQQARAKERQAQGNEHHTQNEPDQEADQEAPTVPLIYRWFYILHKKKQITAQIKNKTQAGPQRTIVPGPQVDTAKELISMKDIVSSLGLKFDRIKDDTYISKHNTLLFQQQLETKIDGLETSLVRHFAYSQHNLAGDIALLKSQVGEMDDCLKEIRDAKKGEGTIKKIRLL